MTHDDLVVRARRWLKNSKRLAFVVSEVVSGAGEIPDAIGWRATGFSILVECKVSVVDFQRNKQKCHERTGRGMGYERWFMTPPGMLDGRHGQLGEWGLVEVRGKTCRTIVKPTPRTLELKSLRREAQLMISIHRRIQEQMTVREIEIDPRKLGI